MMTSGRGILIIGNYPPPFGGVPRHIEYLVPYLVEHGWRVHVLSGGHSGVVEKGGATIYKPSWPVMAQELLRFQLGIGSLPYWRMRWRTLDRVKIWYGHYMSYISLGRRIIRKHRIDVISAYNLYSYAPIGTILSEEAGIPLVVTNFGEIFSKAAFFKTHVSMVKQICAAASKLLAMSRHCAESYWRIGLRPKVEVIPYGVDVERFSPNNDRMRVRNLHGITPTSRVVLFVGRLVRDMGLHTVLAAIPRVLSNPKAVVAIVGQRGELLGSARTVAKRFPGRVIVTADLPFADLPDYYAAADVVIAPTQGERACGSLAAIEAMATGRPVVAAAVGGIPEIVVDGVTGKLVPPDHPTTLAEAVLELLDDECARGEMGRAARARVLDHFDERAIDGRIERCFRQCTGM